jgi:hypothetical protein
MSLQDLFNIKVNILRITSTPGAMGATEVANVLHSNLPCRISWKRGNEKVMFDKDTYLRDAKLFCSVVDVTKDDRVQYGARTYQVVDVDNAHNMGEFLTLTLKLVE